MTARFAAATLLVLTLVAGARPAPAAPPEGTMVLGLHVTLVSRWLDPGETEALITPCLLYTSPSPRDRQKSRMPSSA